MKKPWNIYFLLFDCVELLDFAGPFDVFSMANIAIDLNAPAPPECTKPGEHYKLCTVSECGGMVTALHGLRILPDYSFRTCPYDQIDMLIIPGSAPQTVVDYINQNPQVVDWVREHSQHIQIVASVCVGALFLAKAGVFHGRQATTHHGALPQLEEWAPCAEIKPGARYVDNKLAKDRHVLSSAGVSAGIDLAFYILRNIAGNDAIANNTATIMEYNATSNYVFNELKSIDLQ